MSRRVPCLKVRLIRPTGEITLTEEFPTESRAEDRYKRLVAACFKDRWLGARVQCLGADDSVVHERVIWF